MKERENTRKEAGLGAGAQIRGKKGEEGAARLSYF